MKTILAVLFILTGAALAPVTAQVEHAPGCGAVSGGSEIVAIAKPNEGGPGRIPGWCP
jgi:hypothetical protein